MGSDPQGDPAVNAETAGLNGLSRDPAAIEADIARQREDLARTIDALGERLDVKARAEEKVSDLKASVTTDSGRPRPELVLAATAAVAGLAVLVWWRHRS
jgi:hypothetical protein